MSAQINNSRMLIITAVTLCTFFCGCGEDKEKNNSYVPPDTNCVEYDPVELDNINIDLGISNEDLKGLDLSINYLYGNESVGILEASAISIEGSNTRIVLGGIMKRIEGQASYPFDFNDTPVQNLSADNFKVLVEGESVDPVKVSCTGSKQEITLVLLVDVTSAAFPLFVPLRKNIQDFIEKADELNLKLNIGVVTYQDTVGVNIPFDDCSSVQEDIPVRSPFLPPKDVSDSEQVEELRAFLDSLHDDQGDGISNNNLAAAVDFAANNVIGYDSMGNPNIIGDGVDDPAYVEPWPVEEMKGSVFFVTLTDNAAFNSNYYNDDSVSIKKEFGPRNLVEILGSLSNIVIGVVDSPTYTGLDTDWSFIRKHLAETHHTNIDPDFWPRYTGGFGMDNYAVDIVVGVFHVRNISYFDSQIFQLKKGLSGIPVAPFMASTCIIEIPTETAPENILIQLDVDGEVVEIEPESMIVDR